MHRILIVDEDEHLLWALEKNLFPERDDLEVTTVSDGEEGLEILKEGEVDLLISDIKMPGEVDGFQLILRAKEIAPEARVIIMTAFGSGRIESFADKMGITHYVEKPFNISDLRDIALDLLDEKEGFQGMLSDLELTDIIQMLCLSKRSTLLHLKHRDHRGKIVFDQGDLVHAEFDNEEGADAVYEMLALRQGDIFMESDVEYDERTIDVGWQDLLLEAAKRADEKRLAEQTGAEVSGDEGTPFASFRPSESAEIDLEEVARRESAMANPEPDAGTGEEEEAHTSRLAGDSFFTDEELEEIGVASSEAIEDSDIFDAPADEASEGEVEIGGLAESSAGDSVLSDSSAGEAVAEESSVAESVAEEGASSGRGDSAVEEDESGADLEVLEPVEPGRGEAGGGVGLAADGGHHQRLSADSSGTEALEELSESQIGGLLEGFADECAQLKVTGLAGFEALEPAVVAVDGQIAGQPPRITEKVLEVIGCADRVADAMTDGTATGEVQLVLPDSYVVMRRVGSGDHFHFAVVEREASLGVVLVLMRQYAERFQAALSD